MKNKITIVTLLVGGLLLGAMLWHAMQQDDATETVAESEAVEGSASGAEQKIEADSTAAVAEEDSTEPGVLTAAQIKARANLDKALAKHGQLGPENTRTLFNQCSSRAINGSKRVSPHY